MSLPRAPRSRSHRSTHRARRTALTTLLATALTAALLAAVGVNAAAQDEPASMDAASAGAANAGADSLEAESRGDTVPARRADRWPGHAVRTWMAPASAAAQDAVAAELRATLAQDVRELAVVEPARARELAGLVLDGMASRGNERYDVALQSELALALVLARAADDTATHDRALRALATSLGTLRAQGWGVGLRFAIRQYVTPPLPRSLTQVDGRVIMPLTEVLVDLSDAATAARLASAYPRGPGSDSMRRVSELLSRLPGGTIEAERGLPCAAQVNGERLAPGRALELPAGTHHVICPGGPVHVVGPMTLGSGERRVLTAVPRAQEPPER